MVRRSLVAGVFGLVALLGISPCTRAVRADVQLQKGEYWFENRYLESYTLENEYLRLSLLPERGGMAYELVDKRDAHVNLIYLSPTPNGYGGLFDDHGRRTATPYSFKVLSTTPDKCSVRLSATLDDVAYTKTITLCAGRPMIEVTYELANAGQATIGEILFRNVIRPSGGHFTDADLYVMPLTTGVQRIRAKAGSAGFGLAENIGAPWSGLVNTTDRRGVSIVYMGDKLRRFYSWDGSVVAPTYEWMFPALEPGQLYSTTYYVKVTHGFTGYSDSTRLYTADSSVAVHADRAVKVTTRLAPSWEPLPKLAVALAVSPVGAPQAGPGAVLEMGDLDVDAGSERSWTWQAPADGAYVLHASVTSDGREIGRYEEFFTVGKPAKDAPAYKRQVAWTGADPMGVVPGWKKVERYTVQPTVAEKERGYIVFEEFGPNAGKEVQRFAVDVGMGEQQSVNFALMPLREIGDVRISVKGGSLPAAKLRTTAAELTSFVNWGQTYVGQKLLGSGLLPTKPNETAFFWAVLDAGGLKPGEYAATIVLEPAHAPAKELPFIVRVAPVQLPEDLRIFFNPNSLFDDLASSGKGAAWQWDEPKARRYAEDMRSHGIRVLTAYGLRAVGAAPDRIKLRATGEPLLEAIRKNPERFRSGELPALDLSAWDWFVNLALEYDQYLYHTTLGNEMTYDSAFLAVSRLIYGKDVAVSSPEHARIRRWLRGATPAYLREKGYRRILATISDEIPFDRFPKWAEKAAEARSGGWQTGVTTGLATLFDPTYFKLLASQSEYWIIGQLNDEALRNAEKSGLIKPTDWVETYCSSANYWRSYEHMRRWAGWWPAYFELDDVWIQCYWRRQAESVIFADDVNGPKDTGAWEGCRDGLQDANYYLMALDIVRAMENGPATAALGKKARMELESISGKDPNSLVRFEYQKAGGGDALECVTTDTWRFREAKRRLLEFIAKYQPQSPRQGPLVKWGQTAIVRDGRPMFDIRFGAGLDEAAAALAAHIDARTTAGRISVKPLEPVLQPAGAGQIVVASREDAALLDGLARQGLPLGLTPTYPAAGSYLVWQGPSPWDKDKDLILIVGSDRAGALQGAKNACKFIRTVRPEFR